VAAFVRRLIAFCRKLRLPVVFTDIEPFDRADDYPENTAYIGYDGRKHSSPFSSRCAEATK
jgi:hypothetical protein